MKAYSNANAEYWLILLYTFIRILFFHIISTAYFQYITRPNQQEQQHLQSVMQLKPI